MKTLTGQSKPDSITAGIAPRTADPESLWVTTRRYGLRPAPGGLALVQDLLNTRANTEHGLDLLSDATHAQEWVELAAFAWAARRGVESAPPALTDHDASKIRDLRDTVDGLLAGGSPHSAQRLDGVPELVLLKGGEIYWAPTGKGWRWVSCAILGEVLLSRHTHNGTWERLKQCRNSVCRVTFYDRSWNTSEIWHHRVMCSQAFTDHGTVQNQTLQANWS